MQYRQGDVLLVRDDSASIEGEEVPRSRGHVVLANGEQTGHAHAIADATATLFHSPILPYCVLELRAPAQLRHGKLGKPTGDHASILLPAGRYRVIRQREYTAEGPRNRRLRRVPEWHFVGD